VRLRLRSLEAICTFAIAATFGGCTLPNDEPRSPLESVSRPTANDLQQAQVDWAHREAGAEGMAHCNRVEGLSCRGLSTPQTFQCKYREWSATRPWPSMTAIIRHDGARWRWVSGDLPICSIIVIRQAN
jgi:hypothetical protein